jgi:nitrous oxide reductase accessory protein NosL
MARSFAIALLVLGAASAGCGKETGVAPPQIRYGQDTCAVCGMIISDERFAAGLVIGTAPRYQALAFDDLGCLLGYERSAPDAVVAARYVRDFQAPQWRDAGTATYVHGPALHSPMGFNLAASETAADARALAAARGGDVLDYASVRVRFEAGDLTRPSGG